MASEGRLRRALAAAGLQAAFTARSSSVRSTGLATMPMAPASKARFFSSMMLRITTGIEAVTGSRCRASSTDQPSKSGMTMSSRMASGRTVRAS